MKVHVVLREDQNEYGFIDTSVVGLFRNRRDANAFVRSSTLEARKEGLSLYGDPEHDADWNVCWLVESHALS